MHISIKRFCSVFVLWLFVARSRAQALTLVVNSDEITYVPVGNTLELNVSYTYTGTKTVIVLWNFKGTSIVGKVGNDPPQGTNSRVTIHGKGSLVLYKTTLSDNGTYSISVQSLGEAQRESSFQVIIEVPPVANISCFGKTSRDFVCACKSQNNVGNPPPLAFWYKNGEQIGRFGFLQKILYTDNITREVAKYTCKVKSYKLIDNQSITFRKPEIMSFTIRKPSPLNGATMLICKANGLLPITYSIIFNGIYLNDVNNGVKIIKSVTNIDAGLYKCIATNIIGNSSKELTLNTRGEEEKTTSRPSDATPNTTSKETLSYNCDRRGTQWYLILIAVTVGIFLGMIVMYLMLRLRKRLDKNRNFSKSSNPGATQGNNSEYQELDLRQLNNRDNYQSLILRSQVPRNLERQNEPDTDYEELSNVRENEENYESLKS